MSELKWSILIGGLITWFLGLVFLFALRVITSASLVSWMIGCSFSLALIETITLSLDDKKIVWMMRYTEDRMTKLREKERQEELSRIQERERQDSFDKIHEEERRKPDNQ